MTSFLHPVRLLPAAFLLLTAYFAQARQSEVVAGVAPEPAFFEQLEGGAVVVGVPDAELDTTWVGPAGEANGGRVELSRRPVTDVGAWLRGVPGVGAVRRGGRGFDPSIRGLSEANVAVYIDGVRALSGDPLCTDSPVGHFDPSDVSRIEIVKGPYALTWGAALSTIRIEQFGAAPPSGVHGMVQAGYLTNLGAFETAGAVAGREQAWAYAIHGAYRTGGDYTAGDGERIESGYRDAALQARASYHPAPGRELTLSGSLSRERNVDFPGLPLDSSEMDSRTLSARYRQTDDEGRLHHLEVLLYTSAREGGMDNNGKPTALPDAGRAWPFPLLITTDSDLSYLGGRLAAGFMLYGTLPFTVGVDFLRSRWNASRRIKRRDAPEVLDDHQVWPDARIGTFGIFVANAAEVGRLRLSGTMRVDLNRADADADRIDDYFFLHAEDTPLTPEDLAASEVNLSLAGTLRMPLSDEVEVGLGLGSAARTATPSERYRDRFPISRSHSQAEVVGHPTFEPERATEVDLWGRADYPRWRVAGSVFGRLMSDFTFLFPTRLEKRLPISPDVVYKYLSGEGRYYGFEVEGAYALKDPLTVTLAASYLHGGVGKKSAPVFGVSPAQAAVGVRYMERSGRYFAEGELHLAASQERVEVLSNEASTDGYATLDLHAGARLQPSIAVYAGINNVFDAAYADHLNARDPFTQVQLMEPGRHLYAKVRFTY